MEDLPDELLAEILRRLPPRGLAACRTICKHWRAAVDARGLLAAVAHLVPRLLRGIFINYVPDRSLRFFNRTTPAETSTQSSMDVTLSFLPGNLSRHRGVLEHRSGLLLYENGQAMYVCNPATRRWATLPPPPRVPPAHRHLPYYRRRLYLMFDPTVSLHYDVFFFPDVLDKKQDLQPDGEPQCSATEYEHERNSSWGSKEWPPCMYPVQVFSSRTNRWEEKPFIRTGDAAVTISDVSSDRLSPISSRCTRRNHAVFWQASFYVHCDIGFIMRLSLEEQKYQVIKTPKLDTTGCKRRLRTYGYLGKSKHGVYYTAIHAYQFHMWVLHNTAESSQTPDWELKHQVDLEQKFRQHIRSEMTVKCWTVGSRGEEPQERGDYEWDSSDDSVIDAKEGINMDYEDYYFPVDMLGYHPRKEIAFLGNRFQGFAYYLDNSKLQYLGSPYPVQLDKHHHRGLPLVESFIYTPCMDDLLPCSE